MPRSDAAPDHHSDFCDPAKRRLILIAAILASALSFIDGTVVAIALPAMRASLGADLTAAQWIHNAYMLTLSALILVGGAAGDRFGLARVFGIGIALFVAASILCALAPTATFMIAARAVQGIGAAIMVPGSLAVIARAYPRKERGRAIGIWAAASAVTTALGPIIGGAALSMGGQEMWRWIFAINLPLGAFALFMLFRAVQEDKGNDDAGLDPGGAALATFALLALAWGLTNLTHGDSSTVWIAAGGIGLLLFLVYEARVSTPMVPLNLFASRTFSATNLMCFFIYGALNIMFFFMPMTFIAGWGESELAASAIFAPMSVFIAALSSRAGSLADRIGPAPLLTAGSLCVAFGYALIGWLAPAQDLWGQMLPAMCVVALGMALIVAPLSTAVMGSVPDTATGVASGVNNAVTRMAGLISVAAVGGLISATYVAAGGTASFGVESDHLGHTDAMNAAFQTLAYLSAALALISAAIAALGVRA